jgi:hypothetical protein
LVDHRKLARNAHNFGYRGHCLTKSRRYSTTFKQLRADREAFAHAQLLAHSRDKSQLTIAAAAPDERRAHFELVGIGHFTAVEDLLAEHGRAREREGRRAGREALACALVDRATIEGRHDGDGACRHAVSHAA